MISEAETLIKLAAASSSPTTTGASVAWPTRSTTGPRPSTGSTSSTATTTLLERLNQRLRITDAVLRFRIIKVKPGQPTPPPPDQQAARRRDDREPQDTRVAARAAADAPAASRRSREGSDERREAARRGRGPARRATDGRVARRL